VKRFSSQTCSMWMRAYWRSQKSMCWSAEICTRSSSEYKRSTSCHNVARPEPAQEFAPRQNMNSVEEDRPLCERRAYIQDPMAIIAIHTSLSKAW